MNLINYLSINLFEGHTNDNSHSMEYLIIIIFKKSSLNEGYKKCYKTTLKLPNE